MKTRLLNAGSGIRDSFYRRSFRFQYAVFGAAFGFCFPFFATILQVLILGLPLSLFSMLQAQLSTPLIWIIDTAPLFLGLFASLAGKRQDEILEMNQDLHESIREHQRLVLQMENLQVDLERQIEAHTANLAQRNAQLQLTAQVAREAAGFRSLEELLPQTARLISDRFSFYHTGIFLLDKARRFAVLRAASSEGGARMREKNHRLEIGKKGIVGHAAYTGEPRIALDVGADAVFFDNPDLPETRSEMAIPLKIQERVIGVLDVQSKESGAFSDGDVEILQILGDQIALAIETANLIADKEQALTALQDSYQELTREIWTKTFANQPDLGYAIDEAGRFYQIHEADLEPEQLMARKEGKTIQADPQTIAVPIKIRNRVVGAIELRKSKDGQSWTTEEISLMEALTEQMSLALDSARLYTDVQRRAEREMLVSEITTKIRASNDPRQMLETAVVELKSALKADRANYKFRSLKVSAGEMLTDGHSDPQNQSEGEG